ncbi:MAG TPA: DnaA/Hda family protein, partial [Polyangiaceae bacterium]
MQSHEQDGAPTPSIAQEPGTSLIPSDAASVEHGELAWREAIAFTREKSPASFDQWFSGVQFDGLTDGVLCLRARDEFVRQWVEDYFLPTVGERLRAATGLSIQVRWAIDGALEHPVADRPSAFTPVRPRPLSVRPGAPGDGPPSFGVRAQDGESGVHAIAPEPARPVAVAPPVEGLNTKYTFANFVVGPSNQLAHAASMAAAGVGGRRHNPLFICGGTGLGKTHLVHAIAYRVREERPAARIVYISAERFVNEFVQALQDQRMNDFRGRYRDKCDLLLVDDIHFLAGKTQTQEEFFHAFNALHQASKQIVVTSDKYPQQLDKM